MEKLNSPVFRLRIPGLFYEALGADSLGSGFVGKLHARAAERGVSQTRKHMTNKEIINDLSDLLCLLPGVSVAWKQKTLGFYRIGLRVEDYKSLALLVHFHCNFVIAVEADWDCSVSHDDPTCLRYDLRIPDRSSSSQSYVLGQCLIDSLERRGLLTHEDAQRRKPAWLIPE